MGGAQSAAAAAAAAAYAIAAAGNVNLERTHQQAQQQGPMSRHTPVSPDGGDESPSPSSLGVHGPSGPLNGGGVARMSLSQQQQQQQQQQLLSNGMLEKGEG